MPELLTSHGATVLAEAVKELYANGQTDYSLEPIVLIDQKNIPIGRIQDNDSVIFCCRRGEREIELTEAFTAQEFPHFPRSRLRDLFFVILTLYHDKFKELPVAFAPEKVSETIGELVSEAGLRQLRVAESEKFAHVTFFLNGGNNHPFKGEDQVKIPTIKGIPFEKIPGLSLEQVTDEVIKGINDHYDLIITNFANGDVIGHTSNREAKIDCASIIDQKLSKVIEAAKKDGYVILVTADHGNLEELLDVDGNPHVSHTSNPVKLVIIDPFSSESMDINDGRLADIAPTILPMMGLKKAGSMNGTNLVVNHDWKGRRKVMLVILDGWGVGKQDDGNPIFLADTPIWDSLLAEYPSSTLQASGEAVGLKSSKAGNSEAGHMNIGAGRVILQDDVRLDQAIKDGTFKHNQILQQAIHKVKTQGTSLHLIGLLTEKSSHGSIDYPLAIMKMAKDAGLAQVFLHVIFDGRSTQPGSAPELLMKLENQMAKIGIGLAVTGVGRGLAMDRDGNYAKIQRTYEALVYGKGKKCILK